MVLPSLATDESRRLTGYRQVILSDLNVAKNTEGGASASGAVRSRVVLRFYRATNRL